MTTSRGMSPNENARSQMRRTGADRFDPWVCGGVQGGRVREGVIYCGRVFPVDSLAEDCEIKHESGEA